MYGNRGIRQSRDLHARAARGDRRCGRRRGAARHAVTISPLNGTPDASPHTQISFLGAPAERDLRRLGASARAAAAHSGKLRSYASAPARASSPRAASPKASASPRRLSSARRGHAQRVGTTFTIARLVSYPLPAGRTPPPATSRRRTRASSRSRRCSRRRCACTSRTPAAAPGDIFLTANSGHGQNGAMIIDGAGRLVWFQPAAKGNSMTNLQVSELRGQAGADASGRGTSTSASASAATRCSTPTTSRSPRCHAGNGYYADLHELQITPQGSAYLTAYSLVRADLSSVGGSRDGALQDAIVQEVDIKTGPRDVRVARLRPRRAGRLLRQRSARPEPPVGLLPHQLDLARPVGRRQLPDLLAQHVGGVRDRPPAAARSCGASAARSRASAWARARAPPTSTTRAGSPTTRSRSSTTAPCRRRTRSRARSASGSTASTARSRWSAASCARRRCCRAARATTRCWPNGDSFVGWGEDAVLHRVQRGRADGVRRAPARARRRCTARFASRGAPPRRPSPALAREGHGRDDDDASTRAGTARPA